MVAHLVRHHHQPGSVSNTMTGMIDKIGLKHRAISHSEQASGITGNKEGHFIDFIPLFGLFSFPPVEISKPSLWLH